jgi:hypothetical protein
MPVKEPEVPFTWGFTQVLTCVAVEAEPVSSVTRPVNPIVPVMGLAWSDWASATETAARRVNFNNVFFMYYRLMLLLTNNPWFSSVCAIN